MFACGCQGAYTMTKGERRVKETLPPSHRLMPEKCENPARGKNVRPCVENPGTSEKLNCGLQARVHCTCTLEMYHEKISRKTQKPVVKALPLWPGLDVICLIEIMSTNNLTGGPKSCET